MQRLLPLSFAAVILALTAVAPALAYPNNSPASAVSVSESETTAIANGDVYTSMERSQPPYDPDLLEESNLRVGIRRLLVVNLEEGRVGVEVMGVIHPNSSISLNGTTLATDRLGHFYSDAIPLQNNRDLAIAVQSPVWGNQNYDLTLTENRWLLNDPTARPLVILPARGAVMSQ